MPPKRLKIDSAKEKTKQEVIKEFDKILENLRAMKKQNFEMLRDRILSALPEDILSQNLYEFLENNDFKKLDSLVVEYDVPDLENIGKSKSNDERCTLTTPFGDEINVPRIIKTKLDRGNVYRQPKSDENIAFSADGSPMIIKADPRLEKIQKVLNATDASTLSPVSQQISQQINKLIERCPKFET